MFSENRLKIAFQVPRKYLLLGNLILGRILIRRLIVINPIHKWLPIRSSFASIEIIPTNLVFELVIQKNFYS